MRVRRHLFGTRFFSKHENENNKSRGRWAFHSHFSLSSVLQGVSHLDRLYIIVIAVVNY
jgi:hypothetical protein